MSNLKMIGLIVIGCAIAGPCTIMLSVSNYTALAFPSVQATPTPDEARQDEADALLQEGQDLYDHGDWSGALDRWQQALIIYREIGDRAGEGDTLNNIGLVHESLAQYDEALSYYQQALAIAQEIPDRAGEGTTLNNIGYIYYDLGQYDEALSYYQQALAIAQELADRSMESSIRNNIGLVYDDLARYDEALAYYQQALAIAQEIGDRRLEGTYLNNIGHVHDNLGQYDEAFSYYQQALILRQEVGDRAGEGTTLNNIGHVYDSLGQYDEALSYYERALVIAQEIGHRAGERTTLNNIGHVYDSLGRYDEALSYYQQALVIAQEIGHRGGEGTTLNNIGHVHDNLGQYDEALSYFEQALVIAQEIGDRMGEAVTLNNMGAVHDYLARYDEALAYYQEALVIAQEIGARYGEAIILNNIGHVYDNLGQYDEALAYYQQALAMTQAIGDPYGEGAMLDNIGQVYGNLGRYDQALSYFEQALVLRRQTADRAGEGISLNNIGHVYGNLGQYDEALSYYRQSLVIAQDIGDRAGEGTILYNIGHVYDNRGQYDDALSYYQQALVIAQEIGDRAQESAALYNTGGVYYDLGQYEEALEYYQQAIEVIESIRGQMRVEEFKTLVAGGWFGVYQHTILLLLETDNVEEAFEYAERARARTFLDQLGNQRIQFRRGAASELLQREQELRGQQVALENTLLEERSKPLDQQSQDVISSLTTQLEEVRGDRGELLNILQAQNPELASLATIKPLTVSEIQQLLDGGITLIEYLVTDEKTLAFFITKSGFETTEIDVGRKELEELVKEFRDFASRGDAKPQSLVELYNWLIAPLKPYLQTKSLIIVPHSILHYLPFQALTDGSRYLVEDYTVVYSPSASVLKFALEKRKTRADTVLAMGNPRIEGVPPLRYASQEAQTVAGLYGGQALVGQAATEARFKAEAGKYAIIHIAAHGELNVHNPLFSAVRLAPEGEEDGRLEVHEVYGLDLAQANLVTLSACETQLGKVTQGDEIVGLSRAFIYAGTPSVLSSLWAVEDESTEMLMERFYKHLQEGQSKANALRLAQLEMMKVEKYRHPYYWAAFTLVGEGDHGRVEVAKKAPSGWVMAVGLALLVLVGLTLFFSGRRRLRELSQKDAS